MMTATYYKYALSLVLVVSIAGCAAPRPAPRTKAPVVDRSSVLNQQPVQQGVYPVEVTPIEQFDPILSEEEQAEQRIPASTPASPRQVVRKPKPKPAPIKPARSNEAVVALLDSAAGHVGNSQLDKAAADLERALRIEPRNAAIWHDLGQIRLHQRQYQQAEAMASKSNSLSPGNRSLQARNWRLISLARRSQGNSTSADAAEAKAVLLEK